MRSFLLAVAAIGALSRPAGAQQEPPRRLELGREAPDSAATDSTARPSATTRELRNRFVRDQTVLGLAAYGPAFSVAVTDEVVTGTAAYLVMAGGSFFAAAELTRRIEITEARHLLSSAMALRGTGSALMISLTADASARQVGAFTLLGGLGGTTAGLLLGRGLSGGEAAATVFGHDFAFLSAAAVTSSVLPASTFASETPGDDRGTALQIGIWTATGLGGYVAGRLYARRVQHNLTVGDVQTLWLSASIGALAGGTVVASADPGEAAVALTMLGGAMLGTFLGERTLVRRFDHTRSEGNLVALGGGAGALMGMGLGVLLAGTVDRGESLTLGFATLGAAGGVAMAERYLQPARDAGRAGAEAPAEVGRLTFDPMGIVATTTRRPGHHSLLRFTF